MWQVFRRTNTAEYQSSGTRFKSLLLNGPRINQIQIFNSKKYLVVDVSTVS